MKALWVACQVAGALLLSEAALGHAPITTTVQFDREIVRILDNHCVMCHEEKGPAFPLMTYEQTYAARWKIRQDALDRHMAPWAAVLGYGEFANSNALTQREIDFLVSWAESFGPRNNGEVYTGVADSASPKGVRAHFHPDRWVLGNPDLRLALAGAVRTTVDLKLRSDRWLKALEYKHADRRAVHAVSFSIQETGQWIGSWTPWLGFAALPQGLAYRLPAGSHLVADTLYYKSGEPAADRGTSTLGLYFTNQPSRRTVTNLVLNPKAGAAAAHKLLAVTTLNADTSVLAIQPEVSPGLQSVEIFARAPQGTRQVLLFAKAIPVDWPTPYIYATPVSLRKGTQLTVIEHYDEAAAVPAGAGPVTFSVSLVEATPGPHG